MLRRICVATAVVVSLITLVACGSGGGAKSTATRVSTRTPTKQVTRTPSSTGTPAARATSLSPVATEPPAQPSGAPAATEPLAAAPTDTPLPVGGSATVGVSLVEFGVRPSPDSARAGTVTFNVQNNGTIPHDFLVIKTDLEDGALPVSQQTFTVDELQVDVVGRVPNIAQESSAELPLDLQAGHYVLICNLAQHYSTGMHVSFSVQ